MLSQLKLLGIYQRELSKTHGCAGAALEAVAEAAVKDAVGGEVVVYQYFQLETGKWVEVEAMDYELYANLTNTQTRKLYTRPQASAAVPEGWRELMQGLVECARDELVRCEGMKCREPNCISCNDELEATTSVERSREFVFRARSMLAARQPEVKS